MSDPSSDERPDRPSYPATGILGTGACLPARRVPSDVVAQSVGTADNWIEERIGVLERRFIEDGESSLHLAIGASEKALAEAGVTPEELDAVILATSTPDLPIPGIGPRLQGAIRAVNAVAFDVNAACAGFMVACEMASGLLTSRAGYDKVLVVASDTYSRILDPTDRRTYPLFGDGAGAAVLGRVPAGEGILSTQLYTAGDLSHFVQGGPVLPVPAGGAAEDAHYLQMSGRDVAGLVCAEFPRLVNEALKEEGITIEDIDHVICHQANPNLVMECATSMGFAPEQLVVTGDVLGNTAAASIPIGLDTAVRDGRIRPGHLILMITFGAGMTWGRSLVRWAGPTTDRRSDPVPVSAAHGGR